MSPNTLILATTSLTKSVEALAALPVGLLLEIKICLPHTTIVAAKSKRSRVGLTKCSGIFSKSIIVYRYLSRKCRIGQFMPSHALFMLRSLGHEAVELRPKSTLSGEVPPDLFPLKEDLFSSGTEYGETSSTISPPCSAWLAISDSIL